MKLTGILLIFFAFTFFGIYKAGELKKRRIILSDVVLMLEKLTTLIHFSNADVFELCRMLMSDSSLSSLGFLEGIPLDDTEDFSHGWKSSVTLWNAPLSAEEKNLISDIGGVLGSTDADGQISVLSVYKSRFESLSAAAYEKYRSNSRMYCMLGTLCGALVSVILL